MARASAPRAEGITHRQQTTRLSALARASLPIVACLLVWQTVVGGQRLALFSTAGALAALAAIFWPRDLRARAALLVGAVVGFCILVGVSPLDLPRVLREGLHDASGPRSPFDPDVHEHLTVVVAAGIAGICCLCAAFARAGRPVAAGIVALGGIAWPATLVGVDEPTWAVVAAVAALWPSLVPRFRSPAATALGLGTLTLIAASVAFAGDTPLRSQTPHVDWRGWNPVRSTGRPTSVRYIWDATYEGVEFPANPTVVLRVKASQRASYWRSSTLDLFTDDRWIENLAPVGIAEGDIRLPRDRLLPQSAQRESDWLRHEVTVVGLADNRVVAAAQPMRIDARQLGRVFMLSGGVLFATEGVGRGASYTVWSYVAQPQPGALIRARTTYPAAIGRYLDVGRVRLPTFGDPGRESRVDSIFADPQFPSLAPYEAVWREARRLTEGTTSPYLATLAIERWLRTGGGYTYSERPAPPPPSVPPLVDFTLGQRTGYCQHFAGSMALMLRLLGIPSRVAVGFTSGRRTKGEWVVTDHQAHAWVEAWFPGFGWLPFDPTPGRGRFATAYSFASDSADAVQALGTGRFLDFSPQPRGPAVEPPINTSASEPHAKVGSGASRWLGVAAVLLAIPLLVAVGVVGLKGHARRQRLAPADPRARAEGLAAELADRVRDRGVELPAQSELAMVLEATERRFGVRLDRLAQALSAARFAPLPLAQPAAEEAERLLVRFEKLLAQRFGAMQGLLAHLRPRQVWHPRNWRASERR